MKIKMNLEVKVNGVVSYKEDCKSTRVYENSKPLSRTNTEDKSYTFDDLKLNINMDQEMDCTTSEYLEALVNIVAGSLSSRGGHSNDDKVEATDNSVETEETCDNPTKRTGITRTTKARTTKKDSKKELEK